MKRKTHEEFVEELRIKNPEVVPMGQYTNCHARIQVKCKKCGHLWVAQPSNLLNGTGCPKCYGTPKKDNAQFLAELRVVNPEITPLESYVDAKTKIRLKCNKCGHIWTASPNAVLRGHGCPKCYGTPRKTHEEYSTQFYKLNNTIELIGKYVDHTKKVRLRCLKCGYEWSARPNDLIRVDGRKTGCPKCGGSMKKTHAEFVEQLSRVTKKIEVLGKYKNTKEKILVRCLECGYEWYNSPQLLLRGNRCPKCVIGFQTSYFEQCIVCLLIRVLGEGNVLTRNTDAIGMELDIFLPNEKKAIEPGGWFWHKSKIASDEMKARRCREKGISLLTIFDDVDDDIDEIRFDGDLLWTHDDLGLRRNIDSLKSILYDILSYVGVENHIITDSEMEDISVNADYMTRKMNTSDFAERIKLVNPSIKVLGEYANYRSNIQVECLTCHYIWSPAAGNLLAGHGCPKCNHTYKKTTSDYIEELHQVNDTIEVLGEYTGARNKIEVRCSICGYIWSPAAGSLLAGHGCPQAKKHAL